MFLSNILGCLKKFFFNDRPKVRLVEVNVSKQIVIFYVSKRAAFLKYKLSDALSDPGVLELLDPNEACWLGGYYGRVLRSSLEGGEALKRTKKMNFLLSSKCGRYKIIFEDRTGKIGYIDKKTKQEFVEHPLTIANNKYIISEFDSTQACYIGILAGINMERVISIDRKTGRKQLEGLLKKPPKLRIVE